MKKKMLFLCSNMNIGGFQKSLINLLMYIDYSKFDVDLYLVDKNGIFIDYINENVNIITNEEISDYFLSYKASIKKLLARRKYLLALKRTKNLILSVFNKGKGAIYMSKQIPPLTKEYDVCIDYCGQYLNYYMIDSIKAAKKITYFHNDYSKWDYYYKADKEYYKYSDYIITVSENCVQSLKKYFPQFSKKIICIENIITKKTINNFYYGHSDNDIYKIPKKKYTLVSIGRACFDKGVDFAIETCELLKEEFGEDFVWIWVGPGESNREYLKLINKKNLSSNFIFVGGKLNPYPYIEKADVIVHPARFEGKAVAVEEALIMNKPIVLTNYTTAINQVINLKTGIIVEMDYQEIFKAIKQLLLDKDLRENIIYYQKEICTGNADEVYKLYKLIE